MHVTRLQQPSRDVQNEAALLSYSRREFAAAVPADRGSTAATARLAEKRATRTRRRAVVTRRPPHSFFAGTPRRANMRSHGASGPRVALRQKPRGRHPRTVALRVALARRIREGRFAW